MRELRAHKFSFPRNLRAARMLAGAAVASAALVCASAHAGVTSFESMPVGFPLANGLQGFNWTNVWVAHGPSSGYGYAAGVVSPQNVAFNGFELTAEIGVSNGTAFDFNSAYVTAAWRDNLNVTFTGYVGATPVATQTVIP